MERTFSCKKCGKIVVAKEYKNRIGRSKYCSKKCMGNSLFISFWDCATWEQKVNRLKSFFDKHVIRQNGCWSWIGRKLCGRGALQFDKKAIQAHRASWIIHYGPIPEDKYVCHTCDNIICTNPEHLFLGTPSENIIDMAKKDKLYHAKLKIADVIEIKRLLECGIQGIVIARRFNVKPMLISDIKRHKTWKYVKI